MDIFEMRKRRDELGAEIEKHCGVIPSLTTGGLDSLIAGSEINVEKIKQGIQDILEKAR